MKKKSYVRRGEKIIICLMVLILALSPNIKVFAKNCSTCDSVEVDLEDGEYILAVENDELRILPVSKARMGVGFGNCTVKNKIFSYSMTRQQAQNALTAIDTGTMAVTTLSTLLTAILPPGVSIAASLVMNLIGGETEYERQLKNFVDSGRPVAFFKFETHCVNRGNMYGEPMHDYVVDKVYLSYTAN